MSFPPIIAAANSWESLLIFLLFVLGSAISNWLTKRRANQGDKNWPPEKTTLPLPRPQSSAPPPAPPPTVKRANWEEELRRLLGEEELTPPPVVPRSRPQAPPVVVAAPAAKKVEPPPAPVVKPAPPPFEMPSVLQTISVEDSPNLELSQRELVLARMAESRQAYGKGMRLSGQVSDQLRQVDEQVARHARAPRARAATEVAQAVALLRQPRTARQTFIASQVFGPPKAFES